MITFQPLPLQTSESEASSRMLVKITLASRGVPRHLNSWV